MTGRLTGKWECIWREIIKKECTAELTNVMSYEKNVQGA